MLMLFILSSFSLGIYCGDLSFDSSALEKGDGLRAHEFRLPQSKSDAGCLSPFFNTRLARILWIGSVAALRRNRVS